MKLKNTDTRCILFIILLYLFVLQNFLQDIFPVFKYYDEAFSLIAIPLSLYYLFKNKGKIFINKDFTKLFLSLFILLMVGFIGNCLYKYQPLNVVLSDALLVIKFFLAYYVSRKLFNETLIINYGKSIGFNIKLIISVLFILTIFNYIMNIWPSTYRFGIMANQLFFNHPTVLASTCVFLLASLFLVRENKKNTIIFSIMCLSILLTTLRMKAIGAAFIIIIAISYILIKKTKLNLFKLAILGIIGIIVAFDQINYYYIETDNSARSELTKKSIEIAKDYFPIGTGFGTYGSYMSAQNYSKVYYLYNLQNVHGLEPERTSFISDTFWPMVLGQFGVIGFVCYLIAILNIYEKIQKEFDENNLYFYVSKIICLGYLIISSTSESAFVHPLAIPLALLIGIKVKESNDNWNKEYDNKEMKQE